MRTTRNTWAGGLRPTNKYGAKSCRYNGVTYHSKKEADYAAQLDLLKSVNGPERVIKWSRQVKVPLAVHGAPICNYYVDFVVTYGAGRVEYHEVKGFATPEWKLKRRLFEAIYPDRILKVIL